MKKAPCKNCVERKVGCHARCEKYLEFHKQQEKIYEYRENERVKCMPNEVKYLFINRKLRRKK